MQLAGKEVNIASPQEVSRFLYQDLGISVPNSAAKNDKTGVANTFSPSLPIGLVGETHGTSGQCVSFSLIDAGSVLLSA